MLSAAKKKLTDDELFTYQLCRDLHIPHPDYLETVLTWEQFLGWRKAHHQQPWGDERADLRLAANTLWNAASGSDAPNLTWPYITGADELWEKHSDLEGRRKELGPEHEAKLKAARQKHWEEKRKRDNQ